jgi:hypothetical protein
LYYTATTKKEQKIGEAGCMWDVLQKILPVPKELSTKPPFFDDGHGVNIQLQSQPYTGIDLTSFPKELIDVAVQSGIWEYRKDKDGNPSV